MSTPVKQPSSNIMLSLEESKLLTNLYRDLIQAKQAAELPQLRVEAAAGQYEALAQKLGRIYNFDPDTTEFKLSDTGTIEVISKFLQQEQQEAQ